MLCQWHLVLTGNATYSQVLSENVKSILPEILRVALQDEDMPFNVCIEGDVEVHGCLGIMKKAPGQYEALTLEKETKLECNALKTNKLCKALWQMPAWPMLPIVDVLEGLPPKNFLAKQVLNALARIIENYGVAQPAKEETQTNVKAGQRGHVRAKPAKFIHGASRSFIRHCMLQYFNCISENFKCLESASISMDGTKVCGIDMLLITLMNSRTNVACVMPPQA